MPEVSSLEALSPEVEAEASEEDAEEAEVVEVEECVEEKEAWAVRVLAVVFRWQAVGGCLFVCWAEVLTAPGGWRASVSPASSCRRLRRVCVLSDAVLVLPTKVTFEPSPAARAAAVQTSEAVVAVRVSWRRARSAERRCGMR